MGTMLNEEKITRPKCIKICTTTRNEMIHHKTAHFVREKLHSDCPDHQNTEQKKILCIILSQGLYFVLCIIMLCMFEAHRPEK